MGRDDTLPLSVPVYHILLALSGGPGHGYGLIQEIRERTEGEVDLTASTLYGALHRMLDEGWIAEWDGEVGESDGPRRRVYRVTDEGREVARREARRLQRAAARAVEADLLDADGVELRTP